MCVCFVVCIWWVCDYRNVFSACIVCQVVRLYVVEIVVMSSEVACCSVGASL